MSSRSRRPVDHHVIVTNAITTTKAYLDRVSPITVTAVISVTWTPVAARQTAGRGALTVTGPESQSGVGLRAVIRPPQRHHALQPPIQSESVPMRETLVLPIPQVRMASCRRPMVFAARQSEVL
jgi:hypothetical protein